MIYIPYLQFIIVLIFLNNDLEYFDHKIGYYIEPSTHPDLKILETGIHLFNGWYTEYTTHKPFDNAWGIWIKTAVDTNNVYEIVINFDTGKIYHSKDYEEFSSY